MGESLSEPQRQTFRDVMSRFPDVAAAWVFGSFARGEARPDSDLDVAVVLRADSSSSSERGRFLGDLASQLESVVPGRPVDVSIVDKRCPMLAHRVLSEGWLGYDADPRRRIDFESDAHVRYLDFRPTYDIAAGASKQGFLDWVERNR